MGQWQSRNADASAYLCEVLCKPFIPSYEVHYDIAMQVDDIIRLKLDGCIYVKLIRPFRIEFPVQYLFEVLQVLYEMWPFSAQMVVGTDLKIPRIPYKGEFEKGVVKFSGKHLICGDRLGVTGKLAGQAMAEERADAVQQGHGKGVRILPAQGIQCGANAGAACLGYVYKEEFIPV